MVGGGWCAGDWSSSPGVKPPVCFGRVTASLGMTGGCSESRKGEMMEARGYAHALVDEGSTNGRTVVLEPVDVRPLSLKVPTPTAEYRSQRKLMRAAVGAAVPPIPQPLP